MNEGNTLCLYFRFRASNGDHTNAHAHTLCRGVVLTWSGRIINCTAQTFAQANKTRRIPGDQGQTSVT